MKYTFDAYIDWILEQYDGDHRRAMAWLIGRMDAAECALRQVYDRLNQTSVTDNYNPRADVDTTIMTIERELDEKEDK